MVGLDREKTWAVKCSVYGHWRTHDETAVISQSLSRFIDGPDSRVVHLQYGDMPKQVPLTAVAETWHRNHVCRNRNRAEIHFRDSFGAVTEAVAGIRRASIWLFVRRQDYKKTVAAKIETDVKWNANKNYIELCHFQSPWATPNVHFQGHDILRLPISRKR